MQEKGQIRNTTGINRHTLKFFTLLVYYQFTDSSCTKAIPTYHFNKTHLISYTSKKIQHHQNPSFFKPKPCRNQPSTYLVTNFIGYQRGWFPTRLWLQLPGTTLSNHLEVTFPQTFQETIPSLEAKGTPSKATPKKKMALRVINHHCRARGLVGIGRGVALKFPWSHSWLHTKKIKKPLGIPDHVLHSDQLQALVKLQLLHYSLRLSNDWWLGDKNWS